MNLALILSIGAALLLLLWAAGRDRSVPSAESAESADSDSWVRLPPQALLVRCLSVEDVEFVTRLRSRAVLRLLLSERRRLALEWLRQTRREGTRLFRLHVRAARHAADLRPAAEFQLLLQAGLFLIVYQALAGLVRLYGPFRAQGFVRSVFALAGVLSNLGGRIAEAVPSALPEARVAARG